MSLDHTRDFRLQIRQNWLRSACSFISSLPSHFKKKDQWTSTRTPSYLPNRTASSLWIMKRRKWTLYSSLKYRCQTSRHFSHSMIHRRMWSSAGRKRRFIILAKDGIQISRAAEKVKLWRNAWTWTHISRCKTSNQSFMIMRIKSFIWWRTNIEIDWDCTSSSLMKMTQMITISWSSTITNWK